MEVDKQDSVLPAFELACLFIAIAALFFAIYIFPYIIFDVNYEVPHFVIWLEYWYKKHHDMDAFFAVFLPLIIISFIFFYMARRINQAIEKQREETSPDDITVMEKFLNTPHSIAKLVSILFIVVIGLVGLASLLDTILQSLLS